MPQSAKTSVRPRRHLFLSHAEPLLMSPVYSSGLLLPHHLAASFSPGGVVQKEMQKVASLMLTRFWPQASSAGCRTIPAEPQGHLPYALQHLFLRQFVSSSTGLYEGSELVRANQPSWNPKHWGVHARKQLSRTTTNSELNILKKIHKPSFLFWTKISTFAIEYFGRCKEDLQYKSKEKSLQKTSNACCSSFILLTLTGLL